MMTLTTPRWMFCLAAAFLVAGSGCASPRQARRPSVNKIKVTKMEIDPSVVVAPAPFIASMFVENVWNQPLREVSYSFVVLQTRKEIGRGQIDRLEPGEMVMVSSDPAKIEAGRYQVVGQVFLSKGQEEPLDTDRMDNGLYLEVVVRPKVEDKP